MFDEPSTFEFENVQCMSDWSPVLNGFEKETLIPQSSNHLISLSCILFMPPSFVKPCDLTNMPISRKNMVTTSPVPFIGYVDFSRWALSSYAILAFTHNKFESTF